MILVSYILFKGVGYVQFRSLVLRQFREGGLFLLKFIGYIYYLAIRVSIEISVERNSFIFVQKFCEFRCIYNTIFDLIFVR